MGIIDKVKDFMGDKTHVKGFVEGFGSFVKQSGGVEGLKAKFDKEGAGAIYDSWISTGPSLPISKEQVEKIMGNQFIQDIAIKMGVEPSIAAEKLTHMLPTIVNKLSPSGKLPDQLDESTLMDAATDFIKREH